MYCTECTLCICALCAVCIISICFNAHVSVCLFFSTVAWLVLPYFSSSCFISVLNWRYNFFSSLFVSLCKFPLTEMVFFCVACWKQFVNPFPRPCHKKHWSEPTYRTQLNQLLWILLHCIFYCIGLPNHRPYYASVNMWCFCNRKSY